MSVLVEVEIQWHAVYGISLSIVGIDPSYTLGDIARHIPSVTSPVSGNEPSLNYKRTVCSKPNNSCLSLLSSVASPSSRLPMLPDTKTSNTN